MTGRSPGKTTPKSPATSEKSLVLLATVSKTHGLRGEFRAHPPAGVSENLDRVRRVTLRKGAAERAFDVERSRPQRGFSIMKLAGLDRIEDVEPWIGAQVLAGAGEIAPLPEGEFYWYELEGMTVVDHRGGELGVVSRLFATGSNDVLVVGSGARERYIPYTDDAVERVDRDARRIHLTAQALAEV
ncbi:MAG: 16S rRNA processing protein RimM [Deltaproteobacteria bacterium]|nr:16S rRNA processing protein RimM [Deltaproteobacteria bacterium]